VIDRVIAGEMPKWRRAVHKSSSLFMRVVFGGMGYQRRTISEFRYDGSTLQFRTLGILEPQMRPLSDVASIQDWRGKGGSLGFRLLLQDRQKLYLEFSVSNSIELVSRVRADLGL
jgi:hypothetical protein